MKESLEKIFWSVYAVGWFLYWAYLIAFVPKWLEGGGQWIVGWVVALVWPLFAMSFVWRWLLA